MSLLRDTSESPDALFLRFKHASADEVASLTTYILETAFVIQTKSNPRFSADNSNSLRGFIMSAIEIAELPAIAGLVALYYVYRITQMTPHPSVKLTTNNAPRMMLIALRVAEKLLIDSCLVTSDWSYVAKLASKGTARFSVRMINAMEVEFYKLLGWNIMVTQSTLVDFISSMLGALDPALDNVHPFIPVIKAASTSHLPRVRASAKVPPTARQGTLRDRLAARARGSGLATDRSHSFHTIMSMVPLEGEADDIPERSIFTRTLYGYSNGVQKQRSSTTLARVEPVPQAEQTPL